MPNTLQELKYLLEKTVKQGETSAIIELIDAKVDPEIVKGWNEILFNKLIEEKNENFLILFSRKLEEDNTYYNSILSHAVSYGFKELVSNLLNSKDSITFSEYTQLYPNSGRNVTVSRGIILKAALQGHTEILAMLIDKTSFDINLYFKSDFRGTVHFTPTLLCAAAKSGNMDTVEFLLERQASQETALFPTGVNKVQPIADELINCAAYGGNNEIFKKLTPQDKKFASNTLRSAIIGGNISMVKQIIENYSKPETLRSKDPDRFSPNFEELFAESVIANQYEVANLILEYIPKERPRAEIVNQEYRYSSLLFAALKKIDIDPRIIKLLIDNGAIESEKDNVTPLIAASIIGLPKEIAVMLIEKFQSLNSTVEHWSIDEHSNKHPQNQVIPEKNFINSNKITALDYSILNGNLELAQLLIEYGADYEKYRSLDTINNLKISKGAALQQEEISELKYKLKQIIKVEDCIRIVKGEIKASEFTTESLSLEEQEYIFYRLKDFILSKIPQGTASISIALPEPQNLEPENSKPQNLEILKPEPQNPEYTQPYIILENLKNYIPLLPQSHNSFIEDSIVKLRMLDAYAIKLKFFNKDTNILPIPYTNTIPMSKDAAAEGTIADFFNKYPQYQILGYGISEFLSKYNGESLDEILPDSDFFTKTLDSLPRILQLIEKVESFYAKVPHNQDAPMDCQESSTSPTLDEYSALQYDTIGNSNDNNDYNELA